MSMTKFPRAARERCRARLHVRVRSGILRKFSRAPCLRIRRSCRVATATFVLLLLLQPPSLIVPSSLGLRRRRRRFSSLPAPCLKHADNKFSSFQRQLNLYGFRKIVKGRESGCYMHPAFLRDRPELLADVRKK